MDSVEDIKSRLDIVDLVGEYVALRPAGSGSFKACCPFHQERTPSFSVSRNRQSWHCFGCNQGGDHFSFLQKMEGMEFREALEFLAQKVGVALPAFNQEKSDLRKRLFEVNELAMKFFASSLRSSPQAEAARAYVAKRGLDDLTVDLFHLGYAPSSWSSLSDALMQKGVTADELIRAGLSAARSQGQAGVYDRFRDRLMFPIQDVHGHVVGFTGRLLTDDHTQAKYVNTPETILYRKSAVLYGLDKAKGEIRQKDLAVLVEGNMDVVASHQFGVMNVVAASGTALTQDQLNLIKRFTHRIAIAFDQDAAGKAATVRGLDLARSQDFSIRVIQLPPDAGKDPDEAVRKDPDIWKRAIEQAMPIMDWMYANAFRGRHLDNPEDKKIVAHAAADEIRRLPDPVERDHWAKRLAKDLDVSEHVIQELVSAAGSPSFPPRTMPSVRASEPAKKEEADPELELEKRLLACALVQREMWDALTGLERFEPQEFSQEGLAALYAALRSAYTHPQIETASSGPSGRSFPQPAKDLSPESLSLFHALAFLAERDFSPLSPSERSRELGRLVEQVRERRFLRRSEVLANDMRQAEREHDESRIQTLLQAYQALQQERRRKK